MMPALLNDEPLEELKFDAPNAYCRFIQNIIGQSILPRKVLVKSLEGDFEIFVRKGDIFGFRKLDLESRAWVQYPASKAKERALESLNRLTSDALMSHEVSLSMLSDRELQKLEAPARVVRSSRSLDVVSLNDWRSDKSKVAVDNSSVLTDFFDTIKHKVEFTYFNGETGGQAQTFGTLGEIDKDAAEDLMPSVLAWRDSVLGALGSGPQLITMRSPSSGGTSLICAVDGNQYLLAEFKNQIFGVVLGLWVKATLTN